MGPRVVLLTALAAVCSLSSARAQNPYSQWPNGPSHDSGFFPICVWLQDPKNAARFKEVGINTYVGLWEGPTEKQLADLKQAGMRVICNQNEVSLKHVSDPTIIGWMHGDEPDNAQPILGTSRWGSPIPADNVVADYKRAQAADSSRPVLLNLGQGVAWDGWYGRGLRTNHPEDYPPYLKGADIVSFDIYPAVHESPEVAGNLWFVAQGVDRLRKWSNDEKIVWNCIECTHIGNEKTKPTPIQVQAEVWMSIIHGSRGIIYFVHQFKPNFIEAALLADPEMAAAVTKINRRITSLGAALNQPSLSGVKVVSSNPDVPVDVMIKQLDGVRYVLAVAMRDGRTTASITWPKMPAGANVEVLDEDRQVSLTAGQLRDDFSGYGVHLYRIAAGP